MKKVIGIVCSMMLITFLFSACNPEEAAPAVTEPTAPPARTETEKLYHDDHTTLRQLLEQVYDSSGSLTEERISRYNESGVLLASSVTEYGAEGTVAAYEEKQYAADGTVTLSLVKKYHANDLLSQHIEVSYWENGNPRSVIKSDFSDTGAELKYRQRDYFENGILAAEKTAYLDAQTGYRIIHEESWHENGLQASLCDGLFHADTYELQSGTIEKYDAEGNLTQREEAVWDGENRAKHSTFCQYAGSAELFSFESSRYYDESGNVFVYEYASFEQDHAFASHYIENRSFDGSGRLAESILQYYLADGSPSERYEHSYEYDGDGNLIREQTVHDLSPGVRQNLTVTEYTYDGGALIREVQTGFDDAGAQKFQQIKEFDPYGKVMTFVTVSTKGNRYTYSYTYDEAGRVETELLTTEYRYGTRIDYQETTYEYHENWNLKRVSVHSWTSHDEAKYPDAAPGDWGKNTVTEYDEDGNKI